MILITGATGTVGSEVIKRLCTHGVQIRAVTPASRLDVIMFPSLAPTFRACDSTRVPFGGSVMPRRNLPDN